MIAFIGDLRSKYEAKVNEFESNKGNFVRLMPNSSPLVEMIVWLHQVKIRVKSTAAIVAKVLGQVNGESKFQDEAVNLGILFLLIFYIYNRV